MLLDMSQDPHPFLRMQILNFQVNNSNQFVNLADVQTQVELKEKNRTARDNGESKSETNWLRLLILRLL